MKISSTRLEGDTLKKTSRTPTSNRVGDLDPTILQGGCYPEKATSCTP